MTEVEESLGPWLDALGKLTATPEAAHRFRECRYRYAHVVAECLTAEGRSDGHLVYGVQMPWGPLYIGQTRDGRRRLRDLVIGESHHLANTFPPEIWGTVVVIRWPELSLATPAIAGEGLDATGLALEYVLQERLQPLFNAHKRTREGGWRAANYSISQSRAAAMSRSSAILHLGDAVEALWFKATNRAEEASPGSAWFGLHLPL